MFSQIRFSHIAIIWFLFAVPLTADEPATRPSEVCTAGSSFFVDEVWAKVGEQICLKCHNHEGDAAGSEFILRSTISNRGSLRHNLAAFLRMAKLEEDGKSRLLLKAAGGLDHEGGQVLQPNSPAYRILQQFAEQIRAKPDESAASQFALNDDAPPLFENVRMIDDQRLLRRLTLSLGARLPTHEERAAIDEGGMEAIDELLDGLMREDAFYARLKEGFNDIFLTTVPRNGEELLSWAHFPNRTWTQKFDLSKIGDGSTDERARWALAAVYRQSIKREPLEMIAYIVRNERPFTELVTADYMMVSPYSARGYGIFEQVEDQFKDSSDPFEYLPAQLPALKDRKGRQVQESKTGFYPHAGMLSTFHYVRRYPTTATNVNRLRARMYYQHFLGVDVMALAPRVSDAAAILDEYEVPTMEANDCVVCHKTVDPVAGLFQDFNDEGQFGPRKEGWHTDMFGPGLEGEELPQSERWRALQWLGERTAKDPRFATAMVEHVWYILFGRRVLKAPQDIDDPLFGPRRRAYQAQRALIEQVARKFADANFNLKMVFKSLAASKFYRADGLAMLVNDPCREAELDDLGLVRLLTPEQLERKITAVFGNQWGRLTGRESKFEILYGGIDAHAVTERVTQPSGVMGAIQRIMSNDVACRNVALDFTRVSTERRLFPGVELSDVPGDDSDAEKRIRAAIVHLHQRLLGQQRAADHADIERTYQLFAGIIHDAKQVGFDKNGSWSCERVNDAWVEDPQYTLRAWRGVVTYLLRQQEFLYE